MLTSAARRLKRLWRNRSGNVAVLFAFCALPLIGVVGLAIDYGYMLMVKSQLDTAADAAAIAGATAANSYIAAYTGTGDPTSSAVAAAQAQATAQFNANKGGLPTGALTQGAPSISLSNSTITSTVSYSFSMPTFLMAVLGAPTMTVAGSSTATVTLPTYVNLFIILDNSESMGIGATAADQTIVNNATGCAIACHYAGSDTTAQARAAGANLRIDAAKSAIYSALANVPSNSTYQVAVYTMSDKFVNVFPLSNNVTAAQAYFNTVAKNSSSIDLANDANDGGTDVTNALTSLYTTLQSLQASGTAITPGAGLTPQTAVGIVMLITDAVQDSDEKVYSHGSYVDQSSPSFTVRSPCSYTSCWYDSTFGVYLESIDISKCTPIKTLGYKIFTLDVNYLIPPASMQGDSNFQAVFSYIQQYLLGSISSDMTSCASSSTNAYSATTPADLTAAIQSMFAAIPKQSSARISQ
jgi:Flp pilus assembly protein TadG